MGVKQLCEIKSDNSTKSQQKKDVDFKMYFIFATILYLFLTKLSQAVIVAIFWYDLLLVITGFCLS